MSEIYFTPYKVSTITCNANIGENLSIDLSILYDNIDPKDENNSIMWIQNLKDNNEFVKGYYPKKIRKSKKKNNKKKNRFDNQITIIFKINSEYKPNIKIFKNGNIQLTGIKNVKDTEMIANIIIDIIKDVYSYDKKIDLSQNNDFIKNLKYCNFKIRMINTDFKTYTDKDLTEKFSIKRKELHNILVSEKYNNKSSFQPGIYQGVKLEYYYNNTNNCGICNCNTHIFNKNNLIEDINYCKKVTVAIFESGSILITGGVTFDQVDKAYNYITSVIKDNSKNIKKPKICIPD
tara:strand:+ start:2377 stop:3249 length:873 start_codon:yes stop_codon:yes gene_type:complete